MTTPIKIGQYTGAPVHAAAYDGVAIAENTYAAGQVIGHHAHDAALLSLVISGDATEVIRGSSTDLATQNLVFTPKFEMHGHQFRSPGRWLNMQFSDSWFSRVGASEVPLPAGPRVVQNHAALAWASRIRTELRDRDAVSQFAIEGALLLLVTDIARINATSERSAPRWLRVVEDAIDASVSAPPSIDELAAIAGINSAHLLRTFRKYHGATIANYVRQRRMERARAEVAADKRPLSVIALDAGFADQSHFTREFRKAFGETPGQYARSLRGR